MTTLPQLKKKAGIKQIRGCQAEQRKLSHGCLKRIFPETLQILQSYYLLFLSRDYHFYQHRVSFSFSVLVMFPDVLGFFESQ